MQRLLKDWYATMGQLITAFRTKYEEADVGADPSTRDPPPTR
jgi:hypothetical protein